MGEAVQMLDWIKARIVDKAKFDTMSAEEKAGKFPTGVLYENKERAEYCHAYEEVRKAFKEKRMINLEALK